jgi:cytochrome c peroxidase
MKNLILIVTGPMALAIFSVISCKPAMQDAEVSTELNRKEQLGKLLFFEKSLSTPVGQDCSDCHKPEFAFADPDTGLPVSKGAVEGRYGNRNDMPAAYAAYVPPLHKDTIEDIWVGGLFWDGRANSLEEQAMGPPLNPLEMANLDIKEIYGPDALDDPSTAYSNMADAIAAYERSAELNRFDSKYDHFLRGEAELSEQEIRGMGLFVAEKKGNCAACHPSTPSADGTPPLFTDYTYDNLGAPRNPENPFYTLSTDLNPDGFEYIDFGLAQTVNDPAENGKFRVPTLRNVGITPPYLHNGVFKTLYQVVAFYNTRDVGPWPPPEVAENVK